MREKKGFGGRRLFSFHKYTYIFILIYFLLGVGLTYSYLAFQVQDESTIVGNVVAIDVDLKVELVVGNTTKMVPMLNEALSNAINGVGSDNGACIDSAGNLSCQVYKITLTNNGSSLKHLRGTVELYAKDGVNNVYQNLRWRELTNTTTVNEDGYIHGMEKSTLVTELSMASKEEKIWYIAVWLGEIDADQTNTDKGEFGGTVTFETIETKTNVFTKTILEPNAQSDATIDFSKTSEESNTNGIYLRSGTENDPYPIYYYRGNVNNNLLFADTCWKVVRTTETGGLKLIYNGVPSSGSCDNTGTASQIGTKAFNTNWESPAYVGYMYSNPYSYQSKSMSSVTDEYYYGNDVNYSNGVYTLVDTISSSSWSSIYDGGLNNYHYTCFSTETTCTSINYIYYTDSSTAKYIQLTNGKRIEDALKGMLGVDDGNLTSYNTTSSTIKGDNTTEGTLDYWYSTNIDQQGYSNYIEDTVWCNDRSISQKNGWDPDGGSTADDFGLVFGIYDRVMNSQPTLTCSRNIDRFTVDGVNGNGALDYPIGLLTMDETMLAGGSINSGNSSYYLYTGDYYWTGAPVVFNNNDALVSRVGSAGYLNYDYVGSAGGVRPSVSLKPGFTISGGDGSVTNPYVVD